MFFAEFENFREDENDLLDKEQFLYMARIVERDLSYVSSLQFVKFWLLITRHTEVMRFLDEFLQAVRKYNDTYKLNMAGNMIMGGCSDSSRTMNRILS